MGGPCHTNNTWLTTGESITLTTSNTPIADCKYLLAPHPEAKNSPKSVSHLIPVKSLMSTSKSRTTPPSYQRSIFNKKERGRVIHINPPRSTRGNENDASPTHG